MFIRCGFPLAPHEGARVYTVVVDGRPSKNPWCKPEKGFGKRSVWRARLKIKKEQMYKFNSNLDVSSWEVVLSQNQVIQGDVICYCHAACVNLEDSSLGLLIGQGELDLPVNSPCKEKTFYYFRFLLFLNLCFLTLIICLAQEQGSSQHTGHWVTWPHRD